MGRKIPSAHRRQWEESAARSRTDDVDPDQITDSARVDDESGSEEELTAQEVRRRRHARRPDDDDDLQKVTRRELQQQQYDDSSSEDEEIDDEVPMQSDSESSASSPVIASNADVVKALADLEREDSNFLLDSSRSKELDAAKAVTVRHQRKLYESALDLRMTLQKPMQIAARFPYGDGFKAVCDSSSDIAGAFRASADTLSALLTDLTLLESHLLNAHGMFGPVPIKTKRKRPDLDAIWAEIDAQFEATRSGRESTIDYWNRRTQIAAGGGKKFKALNQSVLTQIKANLADMEPLRQRAFSNKNQVAVVGYEQAAEVFDDTDFYHLLLKDLINSAGEQTSASGRVSRRKSDRAKEVDRRASKGRKIRYVVHDKIVNFMAPCSRQLDFDYDVDHLFTHLFAT